MLEVLWSEERRLEEGFRWNTPGSVFWRAYWNASAGMSVRVGDTDLDLPARTSLILPPGLPLAEVALRPVEHAYVHFRWVQGIWIGPPSILHFERPPTAGLSPMAFDSGSDGLRLMAWLANLLAMAVDSGSVATDAKLGADPALRPALRLIDEGLADPPRNADLAGACSLSQTQFIRRFRAAFGETPQHMARKTRLRHAARSLMHTDLTIEAIAQQTGFADRVHFTHAFSGSFRVSPAAYRRDRRADHITELDLKLNRPEMER